MIQAAFDVIVAALDADPGDGRSAGRHALRSTDGLVLPLEIERWMDRPDLREQRLLARALPPVLDVGCGPARHTIELSRRGVGAIGVDVSSAAVDLATRRGASVLGASVFDPLPGEGRWGCVLLLDGNVGIGGDPYALFRRVRSLLRPGGRALLEFASTDSMLRRLLVRITHGPEPMGRRFPWALIGPTMAPVLAHATGFRVEELWKDGGRWFAHLDAV